MTQLWKEETPGWVRQTGISHVRHTGIGLSAGSLGPASVITPHEGCSCSPKESKAAESLQNGTYEERSKAERRNNNNLQAQLICHKEEGDELVCVQKLSSVV